MARKKRSKLYRILFFFYQIGTVYFYLGSLLLNFVRYIIKPLIFGLTAGFLLYLVVLYWPVTPGLTKIYDKNGTLLYAGYLNEKTPIILNYKRAPFAVDYVVYSLKNRLDDKSVKEGLLVYTTLDLTKQNALQQTAIERNSKLPLMAVDNYGNVAALVGSRNYPSGPEKGFAQLENKKLKIISIVFDNKGKGGVLYGKK